MTDISKFTQFVITPDDNPPENNRTIPFVYAAVWSVDRDRKQTASTIMAGDNHWTTEQQETLSENEGPRVSAEFGFDEPCCQRFWGREGITLWGRSLDVGADWEIVKPIEPWVLNKIKSLRSDKIAFKMQGGL